MTDRKKQRTFGTIALCTGLLAVFFIVRLITLGLLNAAPIDIDEIYFDAIASNLASGNGFSGAPTADFLQPYEKAGIRAITDPQAEYQTQLHQLGFDSTTTCRPPLYPALLAAAYCIVGRSFAVPRILNCLLIAFGTALIASLMRDRSPHWTVPAILLLVLFDPHLFALTHIGLSEGVSFALVALLLFTTLRQTKTQRRRTISLGCIFGLLVLARPIFLAWGPAIFIFAAHSSSTESRLNIREGLLALAVGGLVYFPWGLRNILVLQSFHPLGSQGGMMLGELYHRPPEAEDGNWTSQKHVEFVHMFRSKEQGLAREREMLDFGSSLASHWLKQNSHLLPKLWWNRLTSFWWRDAMPFQRFLILLSAAAALSLLFSKQAFRPLLWIPFCQSLGTLLSYNISAEGELYGRFLLPLYPLFYLFLAIGIETARRTFQSFQKAEP
jgi:hypothetical protein